MTRPRIVPFLMAALIAVLSLTPTVQAATPYDAESFKDLAGRNVLLLVGPPQSTKAQKAQYWRLLKRSGAEMERYPVYETESLPAEVVKRLGLSKAPVRYATLVQWGNPARFGPAKVLGSGLVTALNTDADVFVLVEGAMTASGQKGLLDKLPTDLESLRPKPELAIEDIDFEANGKPVFLVSTKVRIKNGGRSPARGVNVVFLVENGTEGTWYELGRHDNLEIKAGQTITRDLVRPTYNTPLLNDKNEIQPTKYRIRVESPHGSVENTEQFTPKLFEDQD